jgi:hypothetical protein
MRVILGGLSLLLLSVIFVGAANAETWSVGCTNSVCPIINGEGKIVFFDGSQKKKVGDDQLPGKVTAPVSVSCNTVGANEACVAVDGEGQVWIGPARPNGTRYDIIPDVIKK